MPVTNFINNPQEFQEPTRFSTKKLAFIIVGVLVILIVATGVLMALNNNKEKTSLINADKHSGQIDNSPSEGSRIYGDVDLPAIDQAELKQNYQNNLQSIINDLDQEIQVAGGIENLNIAIVQGIKSKALSEVLPREYQSQHLELVLTMDLIISGNFNQAQKNLQRIKKQY